MRFLVNDQLPAALAGAMAAFGVKARHVEDVGLGGASDIRIWRYACAEDWIVVSKDADFAHLQSSVSPPLGRLLWLRLGNLRKPLLLEAVRLRFPSVLERFKGGETLVSME